MPAWLQSAHGGCFVFVDQSAIDTVPFLAAEGEAHIAPRAVQKAQKEEERKRKRKGEKIVSVKKLTKAR